MQIWRTVVLKVCVQTTSSPGSFFLKLLDQVGVEERSAGNKIHLAVDIRSVNLTIENL